LYWVQAQKDPIQLGLLSEATVVPKDMNSTLTAISEIISRNLPCREIAVVMNSPLIHHQTVSIPPMRAEERKRVLQQEIKRAGSSLQDQDALSFWSFGKQIDAGRVMERVLCAQMPRHLANEIVEVLEQKNLQPIGLTSHSQMVCHLLQEASLEDVANVALVEVNEWDGMITLFRNGVWSMERRFLTGNPAGRSKAVAPEAAPEMDLGQVLLEMGRAFQYFKQQFRNENIGRILVYGSSQNSDVVCKALEASFDVPVALFIDDKSRFDLKSSGGENGLPGKPLLYSIPCSVALHARFQEYIDFLPQRLRERSRVAGTRTAVAALLLVLYGWLGTMWWTVSREVGRITPDLLQGTSVDSTSIGQEQQLIQERSFAIAALQSEQWLRNKHTAVGALIRELAQSAPPEMKITSMQLLERPQGWEVNMLGEVRSRNGSRSQALLVDFRSRCRGEAYLSKLGLSEVNIVDSVPSIAAEATARSENHNLLTFRMTGLVPYSARSKG
jgi:hypothetical protein